MEFSQLQYFECVARHENMTRAAEELHVSQPSLSATIKSLEAELGASLFNRAGKRLFLTDSGRYFAQRSKEIQAALADACDVVSSLEDKRSRTVNCSVQIPIGHPGRLIRKFHDLHPDIHLNIGYPSAAMFERQTVDVSLFGSSITIEDGDVIQLCTEDFVMVMPKDHPLAGQESVRLADFSDEHFIFTEPSEFYDTALSMCREVGFEPRVEYHNQLYSEALYMAEAGLGCCLAGSISWLANHKLDVCVKPLSDVHRVRHLYARIPQDFAPSPATWKFVQFLQDAAEW